MVSRSKKRPAPAKGCGHSDVEDLWKCYFCLAKSALLAVSLAFSIALREANVVHPPAPSDLLLNTRVS
jgi:hypothetical protein